MSRRAMFWRTVTSPILRRYSRAPITILAVAIGATTLSGLVMIAINVPTQLAREIRSYGVNLVVTPAGDMPITDEAMAAAAAQVPASALVGSTAFDYETITINDQPYVTGDADLEAMHAMNPYWYVDGEWPAAAGRILVGEQVASTIDMKTRDTITMSQPDAGASSRDAQTQSGAPALGLKVDPRAVTLAVSGVLRTGGNEDDYVYTSRQDMSTLTGQTDAVSLAEYSIALEGNQLSAIADAMNTANPDVHVQTARCLAQSDMGVLAMLRSLLVVITVVVLTLTIIGVSTMMIAVVTECRSEIDLHKALGATARSITHELMDGGIMFDLIGGFLSTGTGYGPAVLISTSMFHRSISPHPVILLGTVTCSILIAVLACLPPVRRTLAVDPALVLRGE